MRAAALAALPAYRPGSQVLGALRGVAAAGGAIFVAGLFLAPARAWTGFLLAFVLLTQLALAGPGFLATLHLSNAGWATALRRVPEAMAGVLPFAGLAGLVLLFGVPSLYEWSHAEAVRGDEILEAKSAWLDHLLFAVRLVAVFGVWWLFAHLFRSRSRLQDADPPPADLRRRNLVTSALFFVALAVTWSVASFDWLMSLEPHWFSTIYAVYTLTGMAAGGLAATIILLVGLGRTVPMRRVVTAEHLHDLGKLLFAVSAFWFYIWYCQYMLIWYGNLPEETSWYLAREAGTWGSLTPVNLALNFGIPFLVLLPRATKRSPRVLVRVAWVVMAGHLVDLVILAGPPLMGAHPRLGLWELGPLAGALALFFWLALRNFSRGAAVPVRDPYLAESLAYHSG